MEKQSSAAEEKLEAIHRILCSAIEARRDPRVKTHSEVRVRITKPAADHAVLMVDLSRSGLRMRTSMEFSTGTQMELLFDEILMTAVVRRCQQVEIGTYDVGAQVIDFVDRAAPSEMGPPFPEKR